MNARHPQYWCFASARRVAPDLVESRLPSRAAEALAALLPTLGCGEEAAGLAFENLADAGRYDWGASQALHRIACEEWVHDGLIHSLAAGLPPPEQQGWRSAVRRFHLDLGRDDPTARLARIAALDSAVCLILSRLLRPGMPISRDPTTAGILRKIAADEASHVRVTRRLAVAREDERLLRQIAAPVRERLGGLLARAGDAFETLGFDPRWLRDDVARLPAGLFRA